MIVSFLHMFKNVLKQTYDITRKTKRKEKGKEINKFYTCVG